MAKRKGRRKRAPRKEGLPERDPHGRHPPGAYRRAVTSGEAELREKGSRFLAFVHPVRSAAQAHAFLAKQRERYPDASHHCWAWRLGEPARERHSDDGEPSGTAGVPILRVLSGAGMSDAIAVVVRWFGGTRLGKGGLARAYGAAARSALEQVELQIHVPVKHIDVEVAYEQLGAVERLVRSHEVEIAAVRYESTVELRLRVHAHRVERVRERLANVLSKDASCFEIDEGPRPEEAQPEEAQPEDG